ncbi:MAG: hypothetical protein PHQ01_03535 [Candidatus Pacebacteria bacterium]|nr:hypothetical protein [Candidatus Paceibacterota bacterium]
MFNKVNTIKIDKTGSEEVKEGVFNQFVSPVSSGESKPKRDYVRSFLIILLVIIIILGVVAFIYTNLLKKQVETKKQQLDFYDTTPELTQLENNLPEMRNLSQRLKLVNTVYDGKLYVSSMLLPVIESLTESSIDSYVYFDSFGFRKSTENNIGTVALSGVAINYPSLYRQMNNFRNNSHMRNLKMNNIALDESGNVIFSLSFDIDVSTPAYIQYINNSLAEYSIENTPTATGPLFQRDEENNSSATTSVEATSNDEIEVEVEALEENSNATTSSSN